MSEKDAELGLKEVELNELEQEKQPMARSGSGSGADSNGALKPLKAAGGPAEPGEKFTGLSKEELLRVASTPGWQRTRWALLALFWLAWLAMLAGAVAIIVQAPRCRSLPPASWWRTGGVYQLQVEAFQDSDGDGEGDLAGVGDRMEEIAALKVKSIIIGPIHKNTADNINETNLTEIDSKLGNLEQLEKLLETARRKGIKVILDLTPNYKGNQEWFGMNFNTTAGSVDLLQEKEAFRYWLQKGLDGLRLRGIEQVLTSAPDRVAEWQNLTKNFSVDEKPRALVIATVEKKSEGVLRLLNQSDADLLFSYYLWETLLAFDPPNATTVRQGVESYIQSCGQTWPSWALSGYEVGHIASSLEPHLHGLLHVMLFTLPGTPFVYYGDEIGLQDTQPLHLKTPWMKWNTSANGGFTSRASHQPAPHLNETVEGQKSAPSLLSLLKELSLMKIKERSLLYGEFESVYSNQYVYVYTRIWDQSDRFLVLLNFSKVPQTVLLTDANLPAEATVELSSSNERQKTTVSLAEIQLAGGEGLVLKFPFVG